MGGAVVTDVAPMVAELSAALENDPSMELRVLLTLAQRREAAILSKTERHAMFEGRSALDETCGPAALDSVVFALQLASAHEATHAALLRTWRAALDGAPDAGAFLGRLEGFIMLQYMSGRRTSALATWLKAEMMGAAEPDATDSTLADACARWEQAEREAADGYARIGELLTTLGGTRLEAELGERFAELVPAMLARHLPRLLAEERYHAAMLGQIRRWLSPDGNTLVADLTPSLVARRLFELAESHLALDAETWIGDAGLMKVLRTHAPIPKIASG